MIVWNDFGSLRGTRGRTLATTAMILRRLRPLPNAGWTLCVPKNWIHWYSLVEGLLTPFTVTLLRTLSLDSVVCLYQRKLMLWEVCVENLNDFFNLWVISKWIQKELKIVPPNSPIPFSTRKLPGDSTELLLPSWWSNYQPGSSRVEHKMSIWWTAVWRRLF